VYHTPLSYTPLCHSLLQPAQLCLDPLQLFLGLPGSALLLPLPLQFSPPSSQQRVPPATRACLLTRGSPLLTRGFHLTRRCPPRLLHPVPPPDAGLAWGSVSVPGSALARGLCFSPGAVPVWNSHLQGSVPAQGSVLAQGCVPAQGSVSLQGCVRVQGSVSVPGSDPAQGSAPGLGSGLPLPVLPPTQLWQLTARGGDSSTSLSKLPHPADSSPTLRTALPTRDASPLLDSLLLPLLDSLFHTLSPNHTPIHRPTPALTIYTLPLPQLLRPPFARVL